MFNGAIDIFQYSFSFLKSFYIKNPFILHRNLFLPQEFHFFVEKKMKYFKKYNLSDVALSLIWGCEFQIIVVANMISFGHKITEVLFP